MSASLTWLCLIPALAGLLALASRRAAPWVAPAAAALTFLLVLVLGTRLLAGAAPVLRAEAGALAQARVASRLGREFPLSERVAAALLAGPSPDERSALAVQLAGSDLARTHLIAAEASGEIAPLESARALLAESAQEEAHLERALAALDQELRGLRLAAQRPAGSAVYAELRPWLPGPSAQWFVALDGLALGFALAISLLTLASTLVVRRHVTAGALLLGEALLLVAAVAQDGLLLATVWGGFVLLGGAVLLRRVQDEEESSADEPASRAALAVLGPGLTGALLFAGALLWLGAGADGLGGYGGGGYDLGSLAAAGAALPIRPQALLLVALLLACATRLPLLGLHGWLPAAASSGLEAGPLAFFQGGSLLLGALALVRVVAPSCPEALAGAGGLVLFGWALASFAFCALAALGERDLRRQAALSAAACGGLFAAGFALGGPAAEGALLEASAGALAGAAAILCAGIVARRAGSDLASLGGLARVTPRLAVASALAALALAGIPGSVAFVARAALWEGAWAASAAGRVPSWAVVGALTLPLALLGLGLWWSFQRVFLGEGHSARRVRDLDLRESAALCTLLLALILLGLDPSGWLELFRLG